MDDVKSFLLGVAAGILIALAIAVGYLEWLSQHEAMIHYRYRGAE